jgi:hypothetical protein
VILWRWLIALLVWLSCRPADHRPRAAQGCRSGRSCSLEHGGRGGTRSDSAGTAAEAARPCRVH